MSERRDVTDRSATAIGDDVRDTASTREINGRLWGKDDLVYSYPCTVRITEDAVPGRSVQGWCSYCEGVHYLDTKQLGKRWTDLFDQEASDG